MLTYCEHFINQRVTIQVFKAAHVVMGQKITARFTEMQEEGSSSYDLPCSFALVGWEMMAMLVLLSKRSSPARN